MNTAITTAVMAFFVASSAGIADIASAAGDVVPLSSAPTYTVAMTGYNAVPGQTDDTPGRTSIGAVTNPEIVAARSVDLADKLPYGTVIEISAATTSSKSCGLSLVDGYVGLRVIADSMHPRKRNQIDVLFPEDAKVKVGGKDINPARALGICKGIKVKVVGRIDTKDMPKTQKQLVAALDKTSSSDLAVDK